MTSAERALRILRQIAERPLAVKELAKRYKVNLKTIRRDLLVIERSGFNLLSREESHGRKRWQVESIRAKR